MKEEIITDSGIQRKPDAFSKRIHEIDFLRGVLMILVLMDHLFWCFKHYNMLWYEATNIEFFNVIYKIFRFYWGETGCPARDIIRILAIFGFCFLSGISSAFSKNNWVRAGQMLVVYGVIAVGSNLLSSWGFIEQGCRIDFNVIGVLAWSTLFYCFTQNKTWRSILAGLLISFLMCWYVVPWLREIDISKGLNAYVPALWEPEGQSDWLPLFPYMTFFFMGALTSYFIYAPYKKSIIKHKGEWERPFCFIGRHSIIFYLTHQIILIPVFVLITALIGA